MRCGGPASSGSWASARVRFERVGEFGGGAYGTPARVAAVAGEWNTEGMADDRWDQVDDYVDEVLALSDPSLLSALADSAAAGLPAINVAPNQGRLLELLATMTGARRILEVGTLGGYSTICLARSLPDDGTLISLELDAHHAEVARRNVARAGFASRVEIRVGPASDSLRDMVSGGSEPFDVIFIDADKEGYPEYFSQVMHLVRPGSVIVADNVVRDGRVVDVSSADERVRAVREFLRRVGDERRVRATVVQTVGAKGYDGFALIYVLG